MRNQSEALKLCCADFYQQAAVKFFLGDSFHPGGLKFTEMLARHLGISKDTEVLDIACGEGTSAFFIAEQFGANLTGTDASKKAVQSAQEKAFANSAGNRVNFLEADSGSLPFPDNAFDDCITECSFSTFVEKEKTAREIYRILKLGGKWGLSDMLVNRDRLPERMTNLLFQAGCIGQAEIFSGYAAYMKNAGFRVIERQDAAWALEEMMVEVEQRLSAARLMSGLGNLPLKAEDLNSVEQLLSEGRDLLKEKIIGYGILIGRKPV